MTDQPYEQRASSLQGVPLVENHELDNSQSDKIDPDYQTIDQLSELKLSSATPPLSDEMGGADGFEMDDDDDGFEDPNSSNAEQCSLFVGDVARSVTEAMLKAQFQAYGDVVMVDVRRDKVTHNNLGYAFVQMKNRAQAVHGKKMLHGTEIGGRKIRIGWAQKNTTLFIGDLDGTVTTEQLREIFVKYGSLVESETFVKPGSGKFGFARFRNRGDAERAKAEMNRKVIGSRACRIGWGDNHVQKHCVHVSFNPSQGAHLSEQHFRKVFEVFGPVLNVNLPRYANRRLKGYGFVHFQDSEEGEKAATNSIKEMSDTTRINNIPVRCSYGKRRRFRPTGAADMAMGDAFAPSISMQHQLPMGHASMSAHPAVGVDGVPSNRVYSLGPFLSPTTLHAGSGLPPGSFLGLHPLHPGASGPSPSPGVILSRGGASGLAVGAGGHLAAQPSSVGPSALSATPSTSSVSSSTPSAASPTSLPLHLAQLQHHPQRHASLPSVPTMHTMQSLSNAHLLNSATAGARESQTSAAAAAHVQPSHAHSLSSVYSWPYSYEGISAGQTSLSQPLFYVPQARSSRDDGHMYASAPYYQQEAYFPDGYGVPTSSYLSSAQPSATNAAAAQTQVQQTQVQQQAQVQQAQAQTQAQSHAHTVASLASSRTALSHGAHMSVPLALAAHPHALHSSHGHAHASIVSYPALTSSFSNAPSSFSNAPLLAALPSSTNNYAQHVLQQPSHSKPNTLPAPTSTASSATAGSVPSV